MGAKMAPKMEENRCQVASKKFANKESKAKSNETAKESDKWSRHQGFEVWEGGGGRDFPNRANNTANLSLDHPSPEGWWD